MNSIMLIFNLLNILGLSSTSQDIGNEPRSSFLTTICIKGFPLEEQVKEGVNIQNGDVILNIFGGFFNVIKQHQKCHCPKYLLKINYTVQLVIKKKSRLLLYVKHATSFLTVQFKDHFKLPILEYPISMILIQFGGIYSCLGNQGSLSFNKYTAG